MLGSGGMASVFEVFERQTQEHLALKRLHTVDDPRRQRRLLEMFEREFFTLSQLSHPCIVHAYDYGVDEQGAYYTMELLAGKDLQALAPVPYQQACQIGRDLCSALSLLHSRRLVYRDLNPRNVHCGAKGVVKLIDFGAVVSMGLCPQVVGTPGYCAPEVVDLQPLDARTDLYSLGATLYFALTGHHAYPAKTFAQLRQRWETAPVRPAAVVPDIPAALDEIIMALLSLDASVRPTNAAELMEQFATLSGEPVHEQLQAAQAYLSTPGLVGRESEIAQLRSWLSRLHGGRGGCVVFASASGMGRSRVIAACALEAKISGALVLSAVASEASGEYALLRGLSRALLEIAPELARRAAQTHRETLAQVIPELAASTEILTASQVPRSKLLAAVGDWFAGVARERPLMLAIDDVHRTDEPSAACLAWLAHAADKHALLIVASCETGAAARAPAALTLLESSATRFGLQRLQPGQTEELLKSVFGSAPHVQILSRKLHAIAAGNPRDTMRLAQSLVDRGLARYQLGGWSLPADFDDGVLPASMAQAMLRELAALPSHARNLARLLSLAGDRDLSFEECVAAFPDLQPALVREGLLLLLQAQFAKLELDGFTVAHRGLHATLGQGLSREDALAIHGKLARLLALRGDEEFRRAKHLLLAGQSAEAVDVLVAFSAASQGRTDRDPHEYVNLVRSMPEDWLDVFNAAIRCCHDAARKPTDVFFLRNRLSSLLNVLSAPVAAAQQHLLELIRQLNAYSGLDDYAALDAQLEPGKRVMQALANAKQRYDESPEALRGLEPRVAIRNLARAHLLAAGIVAIGLDHRFWSALPSLAPLRPVSPSIGVIEKVVMAVGERVAGRHEHARRVYREVLERTAQPDLAGLDPSNHRFLRFGVMYGLAAIEAGMGLGASLEWAQELESEPLHEVNALHVRVLYELWQGRVHEANNMRELIELRRIESTSPQMADGTHLLWQAVAHACSDDLTHLKQALEELRRLAQRHAGWQSVVRYALGECDRIRGNLSGALEHFNAALAEWRAGTHQIWPYAAGAHVSALAALGQMQQACEAGTSYLRSAEEADLGYLCNYIRMPLAVALSRCGEHEPARRLASEALLGNRGLGATGLNLLLAYDACARVALAAADRSEFERFIALYAECCQASRSQLMRGKYDRLVWLAKVDSLTTEADGFAVSTLLADTWIESTFNDGVQSSVRVERSLQMLLAASGASQGALYLNRDSGLQLTAAIGEDTRLLKLATTIRGFIASELQDGNTATATLFDIRAPGPATGIEGCELVLLSHHVPGGFVITGVAALICQASATFIHPGALATRLSRLLAELQDATALRST
ncbi:MAG TPA: protein kinase [Polyangiales bacterium]|nr:protein kinase [Polyangiales bacterium]